MSKVTYKVNGIVLSKEEFEKRPKTVAYECPDCLKIFKFYHDPGDSPPPSYCAHCGSYVGNNPSQVISAPHIGKSIGKVADDVYRQMESASEHRMDLASEMTGIDRSELSAMKMTDMKDNLREGDIAASLPSNPVSEALAAQQGKPNSMVGYSRASPGIQNPGIEPMAGARAMAKTLDFHRKNAASIVNSGKIA